MPHLYLSPHFDDAALSCGGLIAKQAAAGEQVIIATIYAAAPNFTEISEFAAKQHRRWLARHPGLHPIALRRREDEAAAAQLRASVRHLNQLDAIYRRGPAGQWLYDSEEAIFGAVHRADDDAWLRAEMEQLLRDVRPTTIYAPLAAGGHVDHRRVRAIAETWVAQERPVLFYEDYPYIEDPRHLWLALNAPITGAWERLPQFLTKEHAHAKIRAVKCYESQLDVLFDNDIEERILAQLHLSGAPGLAEVLWRLRR
ncbi:MAG: PIG-L family deacetylase [Chloroflexi bacterium]|nr:PIG-L family deacetylase [Chloroflexota bacterium]